jgi:hypothetical protein
LLLNGSDKIVIAPHVCYSTVVVVAVVIAVPVEGSCGECGGSCSHLNLLLLLLVVMVTTTNKGREGGSSSRRRDVVISSCRSGRMGEEEMLQVAEATAPYIGGCGESCAAA